MSITPQAKFEIIHVESTSLSVSSDVVEPLEGGSLKSKVEAEEQNDVAKNNQGQPSPKEFDKFIAWACEKWTFACVNITHKIQEDCLPYVQRKYPTRVKQRGNIFLSDSVCLEVPEVKSSMSTQINKLPSKSNSVIKSNTANNARGLANDSIIPLTTIYNTRGDLVEISITGYKLIIPQKFLKLIGLALPFHKYLNKLTIRKGGLAQETIYEINKLLPCCNITEVCLDDTYVSQGNFYILLDELTSLRILSLCRCSINEIICENIVRRLEPGRPGDKLQSLSLSTNCIGNKGARQFGDLLRRNRNLLHLNLSDNQITYSGAAAILESLKEFTLNEDEILKKKKEKLAYEKKKIRVYEMILRDLEPMSETTTLSTRKHEQSTREKQDSKSIHSGSSPQTVLPSVHELAYTKSRQVVGDFKDLFDDKNTVEKNNKVYCIGNMRLCYLNLAYNDLNDRILKLIRKVLEYQDGLTKPSNNTGLMKLVLEGNLYSKNNVDLLVIQVLLTKVLPGRKISKSSKFLSKRRVKD